MYSQKFCVFKMIIQYEDDSWHNFEVLCLKNFEIGVKMKMKQTKTVAVDLQKIKNPERRNFQVRTIFNFRQLKFQLFSTIPVPEIFLQTISKSRQIGFNVGLKQRQAVGDGLGFIPKDGSEACCHNFDPTWRGPVSKESVLKCIK